MEETRTILATALRRVRRDAARASEAGVVDDDWLEEVEDRVGDLFRDLAVMARLADRAVDWEGDGAPDPLEAIEEADVEPMKRRELREALTELDLDDPDDPDETLLLTDGVDDAVERLRKLLKLLPRLMRDDADFDVLEPRLEKLLGIG